MDVFDEVQGEPIERQPTRAEIVGASIGKSPENVSGDDYRAYDARQLGIWRRMRRAITPLKWLMQSGILARRLWPFDWTDVMYFTATGLVGFGCWRTYGLGYGYIAGGLMLSLPLFLVFISKFMGPKK